MASGPGSADLAADLRESLASVVTAVAEAGRMRERPLWAIATDSLANRLLVLGAAAGAAVRGIAGSRFVRRASCCLLDRTPGGPTCTSCPHRPPLARRALLADAAARR